MEPTVQGSWLSELRFYGATEKTVRTLSGHTALSRIRRLETYPIIASLTLGHLELGPYSGDG